MSVEEARFGLNEPTWDECLGLNNKRAIQFLLKPMGSIVENETGVS